MDYSRIKTELELKNITIRNLCHKIDITEQGLHQMIRKKSMKIEILERISSVLELPVTYWFDDNTTNICNITSNIDFDVVANGKKRKQRNTKSILKKIDLLTKELNITIKDLVYR